MEIPTILSIATEIPRNEKMKISRQGLRKREGLKDHEARQAAMGMPMGELQDLFAEETPELDPEDPETPVGEGFAPSE